MVTPLETAELCRQGRAHTRQEKTGCPGLSLFQRLTILGGLAGSDCPEVWVGSQPQSTQSNLLLVQMPESVEETG